MRMHLLALAPKQRPSTPKLLLHPLAVFSLFCVVLLCSVASGCQRFDYQYALPPQAMSAYIRAVLCRQQNDYHCELAYLDQSMRWGGHSARLDAERQEALKNLAKQ